MSTKKQKIDCIECVFRLAWIINAAQSKVLAYLCLFVARERNMKKSLGSMAYGPLVFAALSASGTVSADGDQWVEMSAVEPGMLVRVEIHGRVIGILRRTDKMIETLGARYGAAGAINQNSSLSAIYRSAKPEYFVFVDKNTRTGCRLTYEQQGREAGLVDSCTGQKFDFSGRSGVSEVLEVPAHRFTSETKIVIDE